MTELPPPPKKKSVNNRQIDQKKPRLSETLCQNSRPFLFNCLNHCSFYAGEEQKSVTSVDSSNQLSSAGPFFMQENDDWMLSDSDESGKL